MDPARWQTVKAVFDLAAEAKGPEREALLQRTRQSDPDLAREVESLLLADGDPSSLRTPPPAGLFARLETAFGRTADDRGIDAGLTLLAGTRLGPYVVGELLGAGGMGCVYRARDERLERDVALKVLRRADMGSTRFEREAKAVAALSHPNIVAIHDYGEADGKPYMVSELLVGETLRAALASGALPVRRAIEYALQIAHGLAAAHDKGIIHRDLKPENVFITKNGHVKILDFGIARALLRAAGSGGADDALTAPGSVVGTLGYLSPEQAVGEEVTEASDVFSFGTILYEMLSGQRAFGGDSGPAKMRALLGEEPPPLPMGGTRLPAGLAGVVRRCLEKRPEARFRSARDVAYAIEAIAEDNTLTPAPALSTSSSVLPTPPRGVPARRRTMLRVAAAILVGAALFAAGRYLFGGAGAPAGGAAVSSPSKDTLVVTLRPLTYSGRDGSPAPSPDGRLIAFRSDRDGTGRIWLRQASSGEERGLTFPGERGSDDYPRFSPDGATILFTRTTAARASLWRVPTLGGEPRRILDDASDGDVSPDGKTLTFVRWDTSAGAQARPTLFVAESDGSGARALSKLDNRVRACPRFSPDGARIAVTGLAQQPGAPSVLVLVPTSGGEPRRVEAPGRLGYLSCVAWTSRDHLVYAQAESVSGNSAGSPARVFLHDLRTGVARQVLSSPSMSLTLDVLAEGTLLFDARSAQQNLREMSTSGRGRARWLTRGLGTNRQPVFSPDGEWVVFSSNQSGNLDLWAVSPLGGAIRRITDHPGEDWDPAFTPDGQLLWSSNRGGHFEVWRAAADGSGAQRVTSDGVDAENPSATPDGWVVYASGHPERLGVWKVRLDGSGALRLVPGAVLPEAAPDGRHFLHQSNRSPRVVEVGVSRLDDGAKVFAISIDVFKPTSAILGRARWMPDGRRIAFVGQDERGRNGIFVQDFVPGQDTRRSRRPLGGFEEDGVTESFGISPDGKVLVLARWTERLSLMTATGVPGIERPAPRSPRR